MRFRSGTQQPDRYLDTGDKRNVGSEETGGTLPETQLAKRLRVLTNVCHRKQVVRVVFGEVFGASASVEAQVRDLVMWEDAFGLHEEVLTHVGIHADIVVHR